jgi:Arc/MetJ-type ribon-helix-helix transcriptional regulator
MVQDSMSLRLSEELKSTIDEARAEQGLEDGEIPSRAEFLREAARERLLALGHEPDEKPQRSLTTEGA